MRELGGSFQSCRRYSRQFLKPAPQVRAHVSWLFIEPQTAEWILVVCRRPAIGTADALPMSTASRVGRAGIAGRTSAALASPRRIRLDNACDGGGFCCKTGVCVLCEYQCLHSLVEASRCIKSKGDRVVWGLPECGHPNPLAPRSRPTAPVKPQALGQLCVRDGCDLIE